MSRSTWSGPIGISDYTTVIQTTNITTGVTINKPAGTIQTVAVALATGVTGNAEFTVTNSHVEIGDVVAVSVRSGPADGEHVSAFVSEVAAGSFKIVLVNHDGAQADGVMLINFIVFKTRPASTA